MMRRREKKKDPHLILCLIISVKLYVDTILDIHSYLDALKPSAH